MWVGGFVGVWGGWVNRIAIDRWVCAQQTHKHVVVAQSGWARGMRDGQKKAGRSVRFDQSIPNFQQYYSGRMHAARNEAGPVCNVCDRLIEIAIDRIGDRTGQQSVRVSGRPFQRPAGRLVCAKNGPSCLGSDAMTA